MPSAGGLSRVARQHGDTPLPEAVPAVLGNDGQTPQPLLFLRVGHLVQVVQQVVDPLSVAFLGVFLQV